MKVVLGHCVTNLTFIYLNTYTANHLSSHSFSTYVSMPHVCPKGEELDA